jgi:phosphonate transport system ATP-binding protein
MRDDNGSATIDERVHRGGAAGQVGTPVLHVDGLFKAFGEQCAVQDVSFTLRDQELVAVLGPSGAGKTTLFRCVTGIIPPDSGRVWFDGTDMAAMMATGRRQIAIVFQDFNLVRRLTAFENVLGGRLPHVAPWRGILRQFERSDKRKAFECLERVGLLDQAHQRADTLSGGQQQRVAMARALAQEARLIVADEPIASLDPASAAAIMNLLKDIVRNDGVIVICSLHQVAYARSHADRIIGLSHGSILMDKPATAFVDADGDALYASQSASSIRPLSIQRQSL